MEFPVRLLGDVLDVLDPDVRFTAELLLESAFDFPVERDGGWESMTDGLRPPDEDNPEDCWEWEEIKMMPKWPLIIVKAQCKATKVISALLTSLPPEMVRQIARNEIVCFRHYPLLCGLSLLTPLSRCEC